MSTLIIIIYKTVHFGFLNVASVCPKRFTVFCFILYMLGWMMEKGFFLYHYHSFIFQIVSSFNSSFSMFIILIYTQKKSLLLNTEKCRKFWDKRITKVHTKKAAKYYNLYQLNIYKESRLYLRKTATKS